MNVSLPPPILILLLFQVANYGIGGLYVTHTDYLMVNPDHRAYTPWEHFMGDRYATFMVYVSRSVASRTACL